MREASERPTCRRQATQGARGQISLHNAIDGSRETFCPAHLDRLVRLLHMQAADVLVETGAEGPSCCGGNTRGPQSGGVEINVARTGRATFGSSLVGIGKRPLLSGPLPAVVT